jgi:hypothetical protein
MYCSPVICPAANFLADAMLREAIFLECGQRRRRMFCQHWPRCVHAALGCANRILARVRLGTVRFNRCPIERGHGHVICPRWREKHRSNEQDQQ